MIRRQTHPIVLAEHALGDQATLGVLTHPLPRAAACYHTGVRLAYSLGVPLFLVGIVLFGPRLARAQEPGAGTEEAPVPPREPAESAAVLATPAAGVAAVPDAQADVAEGQYQLFLRSDARHDTARVELLHPPPDQPHEWRCDTPCMLTLGPGAYRLWMTAAALDEELTIDTKNVFVEGHPGSLIELVTGIGIGALGVTLLAIALLTGEGACFDFGASCPASRGPLGLGAGAFALALGIGLMFDSVGFIEVTSVTP